MAIRLYIGMIQHGLMTIIIQNLDVLWCTTTIYRSSHWCFELMQVLFLILGKAEPWVNSFSWLLGRRTLKIGSL